MSYRDSYKEFGLMIPNNAQYFDELHKKLNDFNAKNIYDFLNEESSKTNANLLESAANKKYVDSNDERVKEVCKTLSDQFRGANRDNNKADYDAYCASIKIDAIFDRIGNSIEPDMTLSSAFCEQTINELTLILKSYPQKPDSESVFKSFCALNNIKPLFLTPEEVKEKIKDILSSVNTVVGNMTDTCNKCKESLSSAKHQTNKLIEHYQSLVETNSDIVEHNPNVDNYLNSCEQFLISAKNIGASLPIKHEFLDSMPTKIPKKIKKVIEQTEEITMKGASKTGIIYNVLFKRFDPQITDNDIEDVTQAQTSLKNLTRYFCEIHSEYVDIDSLDEHLNNAEQCLNNCKDITYEAEKICNTRNRSGTDGMMYEEALILQAQIESLSDKARNFSKKAEECLVIANEIMAKCMTIINDIQRETNSSLINPINDIVIPRAEKNRLFEKIGYGIFGFFMLFSLWYAVRMYSSLFKLSFSWHNGRSTFLFMLIVLVLIPSAFMIIRIHWMEHFSKSFHVLGNVSQSFDSIRESMQKWEKSFNTRYGIINYLAFFNFIICIIAFVLYILMIVVTTIFA